MRTQKIADWLGAGLKICVFPVRLPARSLPAIFSIFSPSFCSLSLGGFQVCGNDITMGKKKSSSNAQTSKAAAKAAKKARTTQKTERKEKRKLGKAKDEFDDDQDLEAILENVSEALTAFTSPLLANKEYASRFAANGKRRMRLPRNSSMAHLAEEPTRH
jgi:arsenate reductase-like glutaredoxin family protein